MQPTLLLDHEFVTSASAYSVRVLLKLSGAPPVDAARVPLNLSLVLDRSGSMGGEKIAAARRAASLLVRRLAPGDVVSVVAFDSTVETVALPATGEAQAHLPKRIESIEVRGCTNLSGGWLQGREYVDTGRREGGMDRVLLLTDGQANEGITDPDTLVGLARQARERGITTSTIGFGADYDERLLRRMAEAGGGNTHYIETPDQASGVFREELEGLLSLVAQNATVEVRPGEEVELVAVHHLYPVTELEGALRVELGDVHAREPRLLLVEFLVPEAVALRSGEIARVTVTAQVLTAAGGVERQEVVLPVAHPLTRAGRAEPEVRRELLFLGAARAREEALRARERGDFDGAREAIREARTRFDAGGAELDAELREEMHDLGLMEGRMRPELFVEEDAKYLFQRAYSSGRGSRSSARRISRVRHHGGIEYRPGDASRPEGGGPRLVAFVCNDQGAWGKGFVLQVSRHWPAAETAYRAWHAGADAGAPPFRLGEVQVVEVEPEVWTAHLLVQQGLRPAGGMPPLRYDALEEALGRLAWEALFRGASVHMPRIGTGLGGGSWSRVEPLVERLLVQQGVPVVVYTRP